MEPGPKLNTPERAGRLGDSQPLPVGERKELPRIHDLVASELRGRMELGIRRYGTPLQPFNGRKSLRDAYEEAGDLLVYLRTALWELENGEPPDYVWALVDAIVLDQPLDFRGADVPEAIQARLAAAVDAGA